MVSPPCLLRFAGMKNLRTGLPLGVHLGAGKHIIFLEDPVMYVKVNNAARTSPCRV